MLIVAWLNLSAPKQPYFVSGKYLKNIPNMACPVLPSIPEVKDKQFFF